MNIPQKDRIELGGRALALSDSGLRTHSVQWLLKMLKLKRKKFKAKAVFDASFKAKNR